MTHVEVREATRRDVEALSQLYVQLFAHELPGMLRGDTEAQAELARRMLASRPVRGLYVLERDDAVVGMGGLATQEEPRPDTPAGTLLQAPLVVGPFNGIWTIIGAARGLLTIAAPPDADQAQIYSVVVDAAWRGQGLGTAVLKSLEDEALHRGKRHAVLQVITSNTTALAFYRAAGYAEYDPPLGQLRRLVVFPSVMMRKELRQSPA